MKPWERKRAAASFSAAEIDTLDTILKGLLRGADLRDIAARRAPELERIARKAADMAKRIEEKSKDVASEPTQPGEWSGSEFCREGGKS